jgi:hypothetical protein
MWRRWLPLALALTAAALDVAGSHALAFHVLLMAVPAVAFSALGALGELVDLRADGRADTPLYAQQFLAVLGLALVVLSAAVRAPALGESSAPAFAVNVLSIGLVLLCLEAALAALWVPRPARIRSAATAPRPWPSR